MLMIRTVYTAPFVGPGQQVGHYKVAVLDCSFFFILSFFFPRAPLFRFSRPSLRWSHSCPHSASPWFFFFRLVRSTQRVSIFNSLFSPVLLLPLLCAHHSRFRCCLSPHREKINRNRQQPHAKELVPNYYDDDNNLAWIDIPHRQLLFQLYM